MQSGISASQELIAAFGDLVASQEYFGLLVTIKAEKLEPTTLLTPTSPVSTFSSNLDALVKFHLKPDEALYIILRRYATAPQLVAVTHVPDTAPVRQKMLFAATRLTLVRELGSEHFRETIFTTTPEELTPEGFTRHDAHAAMDAPLTEEERSLFEVKRAEQEAGSGTGTGTREIHLSTSLAMPIAEDAMAALNSLAADSRNLVMLKINPDTEIVELVPDDSKPTSISQLVGAISATEPRFTFYRFTHSHDGSESSPVLFFYTCPVAPSKQSIKHRMMYPLMKKAMLTVAEKEAKLQIEKRFEVEEPAEITEESVLADLHPKQEARKGFARPKRPGR